MPTDSPAPEERERALGLRLTLKDTGVKMAVDGGRLRREMINTGDLQVLRVSDVGVEIVLAVLLSRWTS